MYNGVIEREIKKKYNEVFELVGKKVGLSKLTYKDYMGLRDSDTRKNNFRDALEDELKNRKSANVCACIDAINKDVKSEDEIDKIDSFFKLGEKLYPKKEEKKEEVVTPTPDRLFEVNDEEEQEIEQEEVKEEKEQETKKEEITVDTKNQSKLTKFVKAFGETALAAINVSCLTIAGAATLAGILIHVPVTPGFLAIMLAAPVITYSYKGYKKLKKYLEKNEIKNKKHNENINKLETTEEQKEEEKTDTKTESSVLKFENDLDNPTELDFRDDIEEEEIDKPLETDIISEPVSDGERDTIEEPAEEMPEVETELSNPDSEEPLTKPEHEGRSSEEKPAREMPKVETEVSAHDNDKEVEPANKNQNNGQVSSWTTTIKPNFEVKDDSKKNNDLGGNKMNTNDYKKKLVDLKNKLEMAKNLQKEDWISELEVEIAEVEKNINERESKKQEITDNKEKLKDLRSRLENAKNLQKEDWIKELEGEISELDKTVNEREQVKQDFIDKKERLEYLKGQLNYYKGLGRENWIEDTEKEIEELSKQIEEHDYDLDYPNEEVSRGK